jgi:hypothetical protein
LVHPTLPHSELALPRYAQLRCRSCHRRAAGSARHRARFRSIAAGSHADFITEHYWGFTCAKDGCGEYRVEHPRWKIWTAESFELNADLASLCGETFGETLAGPPRSAFIADGSPIVIYRRSIAAAA